MNERNLPNKAIPNYLLSQISWQWHDASQFIASESGEQAFLSGRVQLKGTVEETPAWVQLGWVRQGEIDQESDTIYWEDPVFHLQWASGLSVSELVERNLGEMLRDNPSMALDAINAKCPQTRTDLRQNDAFICNEGKYERMTLVRDNDWDLVIDAHCTDFVTSKKSENDKRWSEIYVYETLHGQRVVSQVGRSTVENEYDRKNAQVIHNDNELVEFLGRGWLAKEIYTQLGIETGIKVA